MKPHEIQKLRLAMQLSQLAFATLLGVSRRSVSRWETGASHPYGLAQKALQHVAEEVHGA